MQNGAAACRPSYNLDVAGIAKIDVDVGEALEGPDGDGMI